MAGRLEVRKTLGAYAEALKIAEETSKKNAFYFLLSLVPSRGTLTVFSYKRDQLDAATAHYLEIEKTQADIDGAQSVLVAVDSLAALRRSYPNYFLDTQVFMTSLERFLERQAA
jgi:putative GTP pyrophosphokinase